MDRCGIVIEVNKKYIVLMTNSMEYVRLKHTPGIRKGQVCYYSPQDIISDTDYKVVPLFNRIKRKSLLAASIAAAFILIISSFAIYSSYSADNVYAYIDLDLDSSIEFSVNKNFEVLDAVALNGTANKLLDYKKLRKVSVEKAIKTVLDSSNTEASYKKIVLTACFNTVNSKDTFLGIFHDSQINTELKERLESYSSSIKTTNGEDVNIESAVFSSSSREKASRYKITALRYAIYLAACNTNNLLTINESRNGNIYVMMETLGIKDLDAAFRILDMRDKSVKKAQREVKPNKTSVKNTSPAVTSKLENKPSTTKPAGNENQPPKGTGKFKIESVKSIFEAEEAVLNDCIIDTKLASYTGKGYVTGLLRKSSSVEWIIDVKKAGQYDLWVKYNKTQGKSSDMDVIVNGINNGEDAIEFISTANGDTWRYIDAEIDFTAGPNSLKLSSINNNTSINIDNIKLLMVDY